MTELSPSIMGARIENGEVVYYWRTDRAAKFALAETSPSFLTRLLRRLKGLPVERRRVGLVVRRHETIPNKWRVMKDKKCLCVISELKRATDFAVNCQLAEQGLSVDEGTADEHTRKLLVIKAKIEERKQAQKFG